MRLISELRLRLLSTNQSVSCTTDDKIEKDEKEKIEDIVFDTNERYGTVGHTVGHDIEHCIVALSQ